jgi:hypothetical protein
MLQLTFLNTDDAPATLFLRGPGKVDEIAVMSGDRVVARGTPAY